MFFFLENIAKLPWYGVSLATKNIRVIENKSSLNRITYFLLQWFIIKKYFFNWNISLNGIDCNCFRRYLIKKIKIYYTLYESTRSRFNKYTDMTFESTLRIFCNAGAILPASYYVGIYG